MVNNKKKDIEKANAMTGMGTFSDMLGQISSQSAIRQKEEEKKEVEEAAPVSTAPVNEPKSEEKKGKKKRYTLEDVLTIKPNYKNANISVMIPVEVRNFLNLLKELSPNNSSMSQILSNIVDDFKTAHKEEITELLKKSNEEKMNLF